jgi:DNA-binding phage protein
MDRKLGKRIYRPATEEEKQRHAVIRQQVAGELPEIKRLARQKLNEAAGRGVAARHVVAVLKAERQRQGLSLADMRQRTGMERSTLSRLENEEQTNPTIGTLSRYAGAIGKQLLIVLADASAR